MPASAQTVAIAAHLHVLLRRKTGRVTDTEWMAENHDYAREVVRFAREKAIEDKHPDLREWADRLEAAVFGTAMRVPEAPQTALQRLRERTRTSDPEHAKPPPHERTVGFVASMFGHSSFDAPDEELAAKKDPKSPRYVGGIR